MILEVKDLQVYFFTSNDVIKAVDGVNFCLERGEVLGIVGQSGAGKTVTAHSILGLISKPGRVVGGEILLDGENILSLSPMEKRKVRGKGIFMIFQSPTFSLNPTLKIGTQIAEVFVRHESISWRNAKKKSMELLDMLGISLSKKDAYPFQLSGGMRQRVLIAMALALKPKVLIADEPTTGLDAITQMEILTLLQNWKERLATAIILITHDLRVIAHMADAVAVMYKGTIVEYGDVPTLFKSARHPHTLELIESFREIETAK